MTAVVTLEFTKEEIEAMEKVEKLLQEAEEAFAGTSRENGTRRTRVLLNRIRNNEPLD